MIGHNEKPLRLDMLAEEARKGLERVELGEENVIGGWLAYGHALNEGRALFPSDKEFGKWVYSANLAEWNGTAVHDHDRAAAMWAAANADQFEEARQRGNPRTIRGIHAKWKEIEAEREQAEWEETQRRIAEERAKQTQEVKGQEKDGVDLPPDEDGGDDGHDLAHHSAKEAYRPTGPSLALVNPPEDGPATEGPHDDVDDLTEEGLKDEVRGLREECGELRQTVAAQKKEIADLKAQIKDLSSDGQGKVISQLHNQIVALKGKRDDALMAAKRMEYRMKKALEEQEVTI